MRQQGLPSFPVPRSPFPEVRQRILILGPSNIGDAILTGDVIAEVHRRFPEAHVTLVAGARAKALFATDPRIHTLVDADAFSSLGGRLRLVWALWRYQPRVVVDLRHTLYPLLLCPWRAWRYLRQPPKTIPHMRQRHLWKLRAQVPGIESVMPQGREEPVAAGWVSDKDRAHVEGLRRRWRVNGAQRLVIICPGARSHIKRWTAEGFARVADSLIAELHAQVVLSGEPDEEPVVEEILGLMRHRAYSAVGLTTIRQLGALMQEADLVITNDSASLHLASALQVPTVAVFGPTDAAKYGPTAPQHRTIRRRLFCAPCEQANCRFNLECMRFVTPEEVLDAAKAFLQEETRGTGHGERKRTRPA